MTEWAELRHAYGTAEDVPALLVAAEKSGADFGPAWDQLWSRLCHQGTVYTASYAALPILADIAHRQVHAGGSAPLDLAAAIVASTDGPSDSSVARHEHADALLLMHQLAEHNLSQVTGDVDFIYALQALMAFEDGGVWQRNLDHLADGELPLECPSCREFLILRLSEPDPSLAVYGDHTPTPTRVLPADPSDSLGERMLMLTRRAGRTGVVSKLRHVLGSAVCPACGTAFHVPDTLT